MNAALDLTPFWCLISLDRHGRRMYAYGEGGPFDPACHYPSTVACVSHRPREARRFASAAAAEAARPLLEPWIESYVAERQRRKDDKDFTATLPLQPFFEDDLLAIYSDGSGLARDQWRNNMDWLDKETAALVALRAFAKKWKDTLAGMDWRLAKWGIESRGPEVELGGHNYRGARVEPEEIAVLFGADSWVRKKADYPESGYLQYDWLKVLNGVTLLIKKAESTRIEPVDPGRNGTKVRLREKRESGVPA